MRTAIKLAGSVAAFFGVLLLVTAGVELYTGRPQPMTTNMILALVMIPILYVVWRK